MTQSATATLTRTIRIGVDIGGTKTETVAIDADNNVLHTLRRPTGFGADEVLRSLHTVVSELRGTPALDGLPVTSLGIGIPGTVDTATGLVSSAVNVGLGSLELGALAQGEHGLPVTVENDVNAAALGAHHVLGTTEQSRSSAYLNLGTGLAAGYVSCGQLVRGASGAAGEIGHLTLGLLDEPCPCGQRGCLELVASGSGIARQWRGGGRWPAVSLFNDAAAGNPEARSIQQRFFHGTATAIRILGLTFDPASIYVGGGLNALGQPLLTGIREELKKADARSPFLAGLSLGQRVSLVPPGLPIGSIGAAIAGSTHVHTPQPQQQR
ncbi:ROK family protein [Paeniglutamicibacter kerguelensis]|uniref:NBD/HSP70 family sugar kinase n=1 Tax=Paeniglutamicibacter kerguelensis TaxID=254788 RepID=A0ABS4XHY2_9MICC|nr:ROK family protein [Paeniglutamicibacter kerguelensis]MBP2387863.1 putative NBD/HSP70 family sugar kinase [Paeniglutamicibacter kerguelensis]